MSEFYSDPFYDYKKIKYSCKPYQDCYEKLLVEDLIADHPVECHYGKCAVIGKMCFDTELKQYFLECLRITGLSPALQVPNGYYRIRVLTSLLQGPLHIGSTVEALGEVVLWDTELEGEYSNNTFPKTSFDLCMELQNLQDITEETLALPKSECTGIIHNGMNIQVIQKIEKEMSKMREKYEIVLKPRLLVSISESVAIINTNLELKAIKNIYEEKCGLSNT